jgi:hypothetical protein
MTLEQRAQSARKHLFERYDQLNVFWLKAEEMLTKKYHIPHTIQFDYSYPDECEIHQLGHYLCDCLGLEKIKGKWRLCHGQYHINGPQEVEEWTPVVDCSVSTRVAAAKHVYLKGLEEEIVNSSERFGPRVDKAIQELSQFLDRNDDLAKLLGERAKLNGKLP